MALLGALYIEQGDAVQATELLEEGRRGGSEDAADNLGILCMKQHDTVNGKIHTFEKRLHPIHGVMELSTKTTNRLTPTSSAIPMRSQHKIHAA